MGILHPSKQGAGKGLLEHLNVMAVSASSMAFGGQPSVSVNLRYLSDA